MYLVNGGLSPLYLDECAFIASDLNPYQSYSKKRTKLVGRAISTVKTHYSLIAVVSHEGVIGYEIFIKSLKGEDFYYFLVKLGLSNPELFQRSFLVLDKLPQHYKSEFFSRLRDDFPLLFLPSKTPQ
jgi:hypothetical protein